MSDLGPDKHYFPMPTIWRCNRSCRVVRLMFTRLLSSGESDLAG
jgi:hypothetical protein